MSYARWSDTCNWYIYPFGDGEEEFKLKIHPSKYIDWTSNTATLDYKDALKLHEAIGMYLEEYELLCKEGE